ncbi:intermembrane transport protein PqiB [Paraburkholderia sp.]|uniref:PqiB family protein n=1 Tax=Paraburkholderia sp. TaxID=1926495 RepID=UPI003D6F8776
MIAIANRRRLPSLVWLLPLVAASICIVLLVRSVVARGPAATIAFSTAEGLEAGKTRVRYRNIDIGRVEAIRLSSDRSHALVDVRLTSAAKSFAVTGSRFWVVRPRIGVTGVSGLGTMLSGAYVAVDPGRSREARAAFVGLDTPPAITGDRTGRRYVLHGESLGSVDVGSPVYHRHVEVGRVLGFSLDSGGGGVTIDVFVDAPYDQYVGTHSRWWQASGLDLRLDSSGLNLNTQSLATILAGGLAFDGSPRQQVGTPAADGASFRVASDETSAMRAPTEQPAPVVMMFDQSLRGLAVGAPVDFRGIEFGYVTAIDVEYDPDKRRFVMPVTVDLYPERLGQRYREALGRGDTAAAKALLRKLVADGLRGQLRTGSLITGQRYVALDMFPKAPPVTIDTDRMPIELPTVPNTLEELQDQIADLVQKLNRLPFEEIGKNLNGTLRNADALFARLDTELAPQAVDTLVAAQRTFDSAHATLQQDSPLRSDVHQALTQLTQTLRSLNQLADYLEQNPQSLLYGKPRDAQH